jgi:hypothetical protein
MMLTGVTIIGPSLEENVAALNISSVRLQPPLWSSCKGFWLEIQSSQVRFPALTDYLKSSGSGTWSTQPREIN